MVRQEECGCHRGRCSLVAGWLLCDLLVRTLLWMGRLVAAGSGLAPPPLTVIRLRL